ncbi:MAG: sulfur oxidation c-type cytochrome SoxX [Thiofilum sp.]|uniref:sulfur oxidation c-type cytochrome SoxX n=1 Tax=Thiofilum sp. TaxID=2212733 RepID=UPI0025D51310|nr:sulfur oxidation c-type cytochrome SoxX [Thiofilum sp.]MBK8454173.1 sulfur oxidation c-type cytochrome SoxX [Thiofilum sp.]
MKIKLVSTALIAILGTTLAVAADDDVSALVEQYIASGFKQGEKQPLERLTQDETQKLCTQYRNQIPADMQQAFMEREKATIKYPESGKLMGDWKQGQKTFTDGFAWRVGTIMPDKPDVVRGGNCYACHAADPKEVAAGNIGSTLTGFGKLRGNTPETIKYAYEKIYNSNAYMPCSSMPRLGHNGVLTPEQIADVVAFLVDPESPVNK